MTRVLDRFDTNGDDVIDAAELQALTEMTGGMRQRLPR